MLSPSLAMQDPKKSSVQLGRRRRSTEPIRVKKRKKREQAARARTFFQHKGSSPPIQKIPHFFGFFSSDPLSGFKTPFPLSTRGSGGVMMPLSLPFFDGASITSGVFGTFGIFGGASCPAAAARMAAIRCLARSSPLSAARTYQTLASSGSRRQPMPDSVK